MPFLMRVFGFLGAIAGFMVGANEMPLAGLAIFLASAMGYCAGVIAEHIQIEGRKTADLLQQLLDQNPPPPRASDAAVAAYNAGKRR